MQLEAKTLVSSWNEVRLEILQEILMINEDSRKATIQRVAILLDEDPDDLLKLHPREIKGLLSTISWSNTIPTVDASTFEDLHLVDFNKLTLGAWVDLEGYMKQSNAKLHFVLACIYRSEDEAYDYKDVPERAARLQKSMPADIGWNALMAFAEHRSSIYLQFARLFDTDTSSEEGDFRDETPSQKKKRLRVEEIQRRNREATNWLYVIDTVAGQDPLKYEGATQLNVNFVFKWLEFQKIKNTNR